MFYILEHNFILWTFVVVTTKDIRLHYRKWYLTLQDTTVIRKHTYGKLKWNSNIVPVPWTQLLAVFMFRHELCCIDKKQSDARRTWTQNREETKKKARLKWRTCALHGCTHVVCMCARECEWLQTKHMVHVTSNTKQQVPIYLQFL
jgi:hypothetical protein